MIVGYMLIELLGSLDLIVIDWRRGFHQGPYVEEFYVGHHVDVMVVLVGSTSFDGEEDMDRAVVGEGEDHEDAFEDREHFVGTKVQMRQGIVGIEGLWVELDNVLQAGTFQNLE